MKLIVGLGNPGKTYARHRHNVGFMALERIAERHGLGPWRKRYRGLVAEGVIGGKRVMLLMPQTYMNDSGQAVGEAQRYLKIPERDIYVLHDEIDLGPGKLKVKAGGGNAGHNGLRSISAHVGNDYARVRIGVGHPGVKDRVIGYVLHDFAKADAAWLAPVLDAIAAEAPRLVAGDEAGFMSRVAHAVNPPPPKGPKAEKVTKD
jgi:PTH1 family peptidyl-tRNA hydrolase